MKKIHKQQIEELNIKIEILIQAMELLKTIISVAQNPSFAAICVMRSVSFQLRVVFIL